MAPSIALVPRGVHGMRPWLAALACAALLPWWAGCATPGSAAFPLPPLRDDAFGTPPESLAPEQVFALSPAMRAYATQLLAPRRQGPEHQRRLITALQRDGLLHLEYDAARTRTASEAFEARAGNCLSLAIMTAALARELDLPVVFQAFDAGDDSFSRAPGLVVANGHVNLLLGRRLIDRARDLGTSGQLVVDFVASTDAPTRGGTVVDERRILAMFFNNRAAEALVAGDLDLAYASVRAALQQDAGFASAAITLGLVYQRRGLAEDAERALAHALALQPDNPQALANMALLLDSVDRPTDAARYHDALRRVERVAPFHYLDLGRAALARGDHTAAIALLQRELARDPLYHEVHYWLAVAQAAAGRAAVADRHLAQAVAHSTTREEHRLYAAKLDRLRAASDRGRASDRGAPKGEGEWH
ncbi:hypothetical protein [Ideonella sp.]|uniref:hypothetical protein n=1 Tax=Ideonella sp. TaxID=1929293 RepID=UPI0035AD9E35